MSVQLVYDEGNKAMKDKPMGVQMASLLSELAIRPNTYYIRPVGENAMDVWVTKNGIEAGLYVTFNGNSFSVCGLMEEERQQRLTFEEASNKLGTFDPSRIPSAVEYYKEVKRVTGTGKEKDTDSFMHAVLINELKRRNVEFSEDSNGYVSFSTNVGEVTAYAENGNICCSGDGINNKNVEFGNYEGFRMFLNKVDEEAGLVTGYGEAFNEKSVAKFGKDMSIEEL